MFNTQYIVSSSFVGEVYTEMEDGVLTIGDMLVVLVMQSFHYGIPFSMLKLPCPTNNRYLRGVRAVL